MLKLPIAFGTNGRSADAMRRIRCRWSEAMDPYGAFQLTCLYSGYDSVCS